MEFTNFLRCPITENQLEVIEKNAFHYFNIPDFIENLGMLSRGLIDKSHEYFYPIFNDIIILHRQYAIYIGLGEDNKGEMSFDKKRVFDYYNEINYKVKDSFKIYEDSGKWVDYRGVSLEYIRNSFKKSANFFSPNGKYLLDIASGPIGLPEYMALGAGYEFRICVDISINALIQAKENIERTGKNGVFICGDITNIPIKDDSCDTVLCQHTLYHIPKDDQATAVEEMYRVAKPGSKIVIIYSWFYHSWFMNISLNFIQIYRIFRHYLGKWYVKLLNSKPRLYFYAHSPRWFRRSFQFGNSIQFFCWRSTNKFFLRLYIHKWFFGERILKWLMKMEERHSNLLGVFGEYPAIVITKSNLIELNEYIDKDYT